MSDDLISRQAAIDELACMTEKHEGDTFGGDLLHWTGIKTMIENLPTVQPEQKTGRWIYTNTIGGMRYYGCTNCANQETDCIADENEIKWYNYCPNCGAKMESEESV